MTMLHGRIRSRRAVDLLIAGAATIAIDQTMGTPVENTGGDALAADWRAIGDDFRRAMKQVEHGFRPA